MSQNNQKTSVKWPIKTMSEIVEFAYGQNLPKEKRITGNCEVYGSNGVVGSHNQFFVEGPGIIIGRKGSIGKVIYTDKNFWPIDTTYYVKPIDELDLKWLYYCLQMLKLDKLNSATGVPGLNRNDVYSKKILFPPINTQQKIATILSTIDEAIQKTDQIIEKTEKLKNGLMNEMLTKGIGHTKFKKTKLGEIPEEWNVVQLSELSYITKLAGYEFTKYFNSYKDQGEMIIIRGLNLKNRELDLSNIKTIPKSVADNLQRSKLSSGDLVFSYVGTIGPVAVITENNKYHLGPNVCKISPNKYVSSNYLYQYFLSELIKKEINKKISVTAQPSLSMEKIRVFEIILPSNMDEQNKICEILMNFDKKNRNYVATKEKLLVIKSGLMNDIFSQKVEVNNAT
ncbi:MAG: restriction endonuclease subunit S [Candidatus Shapirobacteria bacterium]|nr:restriction endonuclease subunit S [Candidatus Shapirobacteria bacterium]